MNSTNKTQLKTFWDKPEGKTGKGIILFLIAAAVTAGVIFAHDVLPYIQMAFENLIRGIITIVGAFLLISLLASHKTWTAYKLLCRKLTSIFITIDPIGVARIAIEEAKGEREKMNQAIIDLDGKKEQLERTIKTNEEKIDNALKSASNANKLVTSTTDENQKLRYRNLVTLSTQDAARTKDTNQKLYPLLQNMNKFDDFLNKVYINSEFQIQNMINDVDNKQMEWEAMNAATSAINSANKIMNGGKSKEEYDLSLQYLEESISNQVGNYKRFMETSSTMMAQMDVQNGVMADDGLKMLAQFENGGDFTTLLNSDYKAGVPNSPEKIMIPLKASIPSQSAGGKSTYDDLI